MGFIGMSNGCGIEQIQLWYRIYRNWTYLEGALKEDNEPNLLYHLKR